MTDEQYKARIASIRECVEKGYQDDSCGTAVRDVHFMVAAMDAAANSGNLLVDILTKRSERAERFLKEAMDLLSEATPNAKFLSENSQHTWANRFGRLFAATFRILDKDERGEGKPEWACRSWGSHEHDWLDCPDCIREYEQS